MSLYKNMSIRNRLMVLFAAWMGIFIGFGFFAIIEVKNLADVAEDIYAYPLQVSNAVFEARVDVLKINSGMKEIISLDDPLEIQNKKEEFDKINERIIENLDTIKKTTRIEDNKKLEMETRDILNEWEKARGQAISYIISKDIGQAEAMLKTMDSDYVDLLEKKFIEIDNNSKESAFMLLQKSMDIQEGQKITLIISLIVLGFGLFIVFLSMIRSILRPILNLQNVMSISANTGKLQEIEIDGRNEIADMSRHYNVLIKKLKDIFWIKDCQNLLNNELRGSYSVKDLCTRAINFLSRTLDIGNGVLYIYDRDDKCLKLQASFAFDEKDVFSVRYELGQGIVGQVGLERKPILLKNIKRQDKLISNGTLNEAPLNIYVFPLVYGDELYGVVELSSFEPFTSIKRDFLDEASDIISTSLYSAIQSSKVLNLLEVSEISKRRAEDMAWELQNANLELEEQQWLLKQQSLELQKKNLQLEEQQQQLEEQSRLLSIRNIDLESSRKELIERTKQLEIASKYKTEFLVNMSHELRTPLNSIILLSRLLLNNQDADLNKAQKDKISIIHKSGQELLRLINDVLDLSKIESGSVSINNTRFSTSDLLEELKRMFEDMAKEKKLQLLIKDSANREIFGDRDKISQILRNFLSNAIKFTEKGLVTLDIKDDGDKGTIFTVTDTGLGIPEDKIDIIFKEFQQVDGSISRKYGGTGLGLSISRKLAEAIGAKINVKSQPNVGSSFSLHVKDTSVQPCEVIKGFESTMEAAADIDNKVDYNNAVLFAENEKRLSPAKKTGEYGLNLKGKKILIVDDDPRNIFVLASVLENYDAEVLETENGQAALEVLKKHKVDLILMDIMMPVMDGYETIKLIRNNDTMKDIPIITLTAKSLKAEKDKCIAAGANDYISKPVDYDALIHLINAWINK